MRQEEQLERGGHICVIKGNKPAAKKSEKMTKEPQTKWRRCWQTIGPERVALSDSNDISNSAQN